MTAIVTAVQNTPKKPIFQTNKKGIEIYYHIFINIDIITHAVTAPPKLTILACDLLASISYLRIICLAHENSHHI